VLTALRGLFGWETACNAAASAAISPRTAGAERPFGTTSMNIDGIESRRRAAGKTAVWTHFAKQIAAEPADQLAFRVSESTNFGIGSEPARAIATFVPSHYAIRSCQYRRIKLPDRAFGFSRTAAIGTTLRTAKRD
jgi:hypothetical protein